MSRLDFFLVSEDIMALISKCDIIPGYRSDHSINNIILTISNEKRGRGFWKFNTSLLQDQEYIHIVKQTIRDTVERYALPDQDINNPNVPFNISDQLFFETLKMEIRQVTIPYTGKKKRNLDQRERELINEIELLENTDMDNITEENWNTLANLKEELENIRKIKIKGIILRSKVQWMEEGEKPTIFFANLEKKNFVNKLINRLNIDGKIIQNQNTILKETSMFYSNLYKSKLDKNRQNENINTFINERCIKQLDENQKQECEGNITEDEIKLALKTMKSDKTPGIDGIPSEFYKMFWVDLGHFLVRSIRASFQIGELSITQKRGIITCLPKGDKPREYLKNWRPISLLTTDYKITTTVMANRMKKVLSTIIGPD